MADRSGLVRHASGQLVGYARAAGARAYNVPRRRTDGRIRARGGRAQIEKRIPLSAATEAAFAPRSPSWGSTSRPLRPRVTGGSGLGIAWTDAPRSWLRAGTGPVTSTPVIPGWRGKAWRRSCRRGSGARIPNPMSRNGTRRAASWPAASAGSHARGYAPYAYRGLRFLFLATAWSWMHPNFNTTGRTACKRRKKRLGGGRLQTT